MAVKPRCSVDGCGKYAQHGCDGMCKYHYGVSKAPVVVDLPAGPVSKPAAVYPDLDADVAEVKSFGVVLNASGDGVSFGVSDRVYNAIRCLLEGVERRLLVDVSGMPDDEAIIYAAVTVQDMAVRAGA